MPLRIVITGPESTGKTTLANALARHLNVPWAPEFARYYLASLGRSYERADLRAIGRGQRAWEAWYAQKATDMVLLDTDWTVLQVWESYRFPTAAEPYWRLGYGEPDTSGVYFLNAPDFPWEPDPLRENPDDRAELYDLYLALLLQSGLDFVRLEGTAEHRIKTALAKIREKTASLQRP